MPPPVEIPHDYNAAVDLLERNLLAGRADKVAFIDDHGTYTYGELNERVNCCANALVDLGLHIEQRVMLRMQDSIDFPVAFLGCIKAGLVPVATDVGDAQLIIGETGRIVARRDLAALTAAIAAEAGATPAERKARGAKARERVLSHFSLAQAVDAYERLYLSLENSREGR